MELDEYKICYFCEDKKFTGYNFFIKEHKGIWIWDSPVLRDPNLFPGYADKPSLQIFYTVNLFDALKNPLNQNYILFKRIENEEISDFIQRFG